MSREPTLEELAREIATERIHHCRSSMFCNCPRPPQRPQNARPVAELEPAYCEEIEKAVLIALQKAVKVEQDKIASWIEDESWVRSDEVHPFFDADLIEPLGQLLSSIREDFADVVRKGHYELGNVQTLDYVRIDLPLFNAMGASQDWRANISKELREAWPEMTHEERAREAMYAARVPIKKLCDRQGTDEAQ